MPGGWFDRKATIDGKECFNCRSAWWNFVSEIRLCRRINYFAHFLRERDGERLL